jgi:methylated-DNA-[protein]-cysteine S-methyltransferase
MTISPDVDRRFRDAAAAAGLLDVAYELAETPIGDVLIAVTPRGLCRISYRGEAEVERLAEQFGARVLRSSRPVDSVRRQLDEYFEGRRTSFELELDLPVPEFHRAVLAELTRVPFGETTTYGALAAKVERPRAARAVGTVMNRNPIPIVLPCHRVIGANGSLVGYGGGLEKKRALLAHEGALSLQLMHE